MKLEVFFTPDELTGSDIRASAAVVIDVLRATSVITQAMASGARAIYPTGSMDDALRLAQNLDRQDLLTCGERRGMRIEGFDLGNSPLEFTPDAVADRTLVMATTNGTPALVAASTATRTLAAAFLNLGAVAAAIADEEAVAIVCAGREGHFSLDDAVCAGMLVQRLIGGRARSAQLDDGSTGSLALAKRYAGKVEEMMRDTAAGRQLIDIGHEQDIVYCAGVDQLEVVPRLEDRRITA